MKLHTDWKEFIRSLIEARVKFLLVGAHAVSVHAEPRFTGDLDVLVSRDSENADRIVLALARFGFEGVDPSPFTQFNRILTLGREPVRIDLFTHIPGIDFESAWDRRIETQIGEQLVPVLCRDDLIASKRASGRPKDLADLALLGAE